MLTLVEKFASLLAATCQNARRVIEYARDIEGGMTDEEVIEYLRWVATYLEDSVNARRGKH